MNTSAAKPASQQTAITPASLKHQIYAMAASVGFDDCQIAPVDQAALGPYVARYREWVAANFEGEMGYMTKHGELRESPALLEMGTLSAICVRMDYLPETHDAMWSVMDDDSKAYISRYAIGRDYHKLLRQRLQQLAKKIESLIGELGYRAFVDSAPVLEKPLAELAGIGWIGKHTNVIHRQHGSWFFIGELLVDVALPPDTVETSHCGSCRACIDVCPTGAIVGPYLLDARRCISYLTIEHKGSIPEPLRPLMGNRIYGCDDCQLVCPWNKFAKVVDDDKFQIREALKAPDLLDLLAMDEVTFLKTFEGSAIRRIGHENWQRNIAIALGNAEYDESIIRALEKAQPTAKPIAQEAMQWAINQQNNNQSKNRA